MMDLMAALVTHVDEKSVKAVCDWTLPIITVSIPTEPFCNQLTSIKPTPYLYYLVS